MRWIAFSIMLRISVCPHIAVPQCRRLETRQLRRLSLLLFCTDCGSSTKITRLGICERVIWWLLAESYRALVPTHEEYHDAYKEAANRPIFCADKREWIESNLLIVSNRNGEWELNQPNRNIYFCKQMIYETSRFFPLPLGNAPENTSPQY